MSTAYSSSACLTVGYMPVPADFPYSDVLRLGRPRHEKWDDFWIKHPPMPASRWAKIFSPFDALDGFDEAIQSKNAVYEPKRNLGEDEQTALDWKLSVLHNLTWNLRMARTNHIVVTVTYYAPCSDRHHGAYRTAGQYVAATGIVLKVTNEKMLLLNDGIKTAVPICDIIEITSQTGVFDTAWESDTP